MAFNFVSYANATELINEIGKKFDAVEGAYVFKGSVAFAGLPASLTSAMVGYVYNMNEEFTIDNRFVEYESGVTKKYPAGTNVAIADVGTASTPDLKFDILAGFIDVDDIYDEIDKVAAMIADKFSAATNYAAGDVVYHEHVLYKFTAAHNAGAWTGSDVTSLTVDDILVELRTLANTILGDLAPAFDATVAYDEGDVVTYGGQLYKFTADHAAGAWTGSDASTTTLAEEIVAAGGDISALTARVNTIVGDLAPAFAAANAYAVDDVVVYEDQLYRFTSAHTANDPWDSSEVTAIDVTDIILPLTTAQITALKALLDTPSYT